MRSFPTLAATVAALALGCGLLVACAAPAAPPPSTAPASVDDSATVAPQPAPPPGRGPELADADDDGIADQDDRCPNEAEILNGIDDDDGCPDHEPIMRHVGDPSVVGRVGFAAERAVVAGEGRALLADVARILIANPTVELEIQGHTDDRERAPGLDVARAGAVRDALVARGVPAARLTVAGYGATRPRVRAASEADRAQNRRVEFVLKE